MTTPVHALHDDRTPLLTVARARATPWRVLAAIFLIACVAGAGVLAVRTSTAHARDTADESQSPLVGSLHRISAGLGGATASSGNAIVSCSRCSGCQGKKKKARARRAACELLQSH